MRTIALDMDGVLYRWHESLYEYYRLYRDYEGTYTQFWTKFVRTIPEAEFNYLIGIDTLYSNMYPTIECMDFLKKISEDFEIFYVTSRPISVRTTTEAYLRRHKFQFRDNLIFTDDKVNVARKLKLSFAVDDSPTHVDGLSRVTTAILVAQPWNISVQMEFPTVKKLSEIFNFIER